MIARPLLYISFAIIVSGITVTTLYSQEKKVESKSKEERKKYETSGLALMFGNTAIIGSKGHLGLNAVYYWSKFNLLQPSIIAGIDYGGISTFVATPHWAPYFAGRLSYGNSWRFTSSLSFVRDFKEKYKPCIIDTSGNCVRTLASYQNSYNSLLNVGFEYISSGGFVFLLEVGTPIYRITENRLGDFQQLFLGLYVGYKIW